MATSGQHVGGLRDSLVEGEASAFRSQQRALAALARPVVQHRGPRYDIGDGDPCPLVPTHGKMFVQQQGSGKQWCAHQSHDGQGDKQPAERSFWPLHHLAAAVAAYHQSITPVELPDLDLGGLL